MWGRSPLMRMKIEAPKTQFALANRCVVVELIANFDDQGTIVFFLCHQWETCHWWIQVLRCHPISNLVSQIMCCRQWAKVVSRRTIMNSSSANSSMKHFVGKWWQFIKRRNTAHQVPLVFKQLHAWSAPFDRFSNQALLFVLFWFLFLYIFFFFFYIYFFFLFIFYFKNNLKEIMKKIRGHIPHLALFPSPVQKFWIWNPPVTQVWCITSIYARSPGRIHYDHQ